MDVREIASVVRSHAPAGLTCIFCQAPERWPGSWRLSRHFATSPSSGDQTTLSALPPDIVEGIRRIKSQDGPDLILSSSSKLTSTLLEHGLADEVPLVVYPVLLGTGKRSTLLPAPPRSDGPALRSYFTSIRPTHPTRKATGNSRSLFAYFQRLMAISIRQNL
jgi:hypothetical protein